MDNERPPENPVEFDAQQAAEQAAQIAKASFKDVIDDPNNPAAFDALTRDRNGVPIEVHRDYSIDGAEHPESTEFDNDRAKAMAEAGDDFETKAIQHTEASNHESEARNEYREALRSKIPEGLSHRKHRAAERARREVINTASDKIRNAQEENIQMVDTGFDDLRGTPELQYIDYEPAKLANAYARRAARIEEWAGILHDHPVSEAYLADHPGLEVTPASLVQLEDERAEAEEEARSIEDRINRTGVEDADRAEKLLKGASDTQLEQWNKLTTERERITQEMRQLLTSLAKESLITPRRNRAALTAKLLDDVRSGRASEAPAEPQSESQPEQQ